MYNGQLGPCKKRETVEAMRRKHARAGGGGGGGYSLIWPIRGGSAQKGYLTFFTLQVYESVGISRVEVYERVGKPVI